MSKLSRILWGVAFGLFVIACVCRPACEPRQDGGDDVVWNEPVCEVPVALEVAGR